MGGDVADDIGLWRHVVGKELAWRVGCGASLEVIRTNVVRLNTDAYPSVPKSVIIKLTAMERSRTVWMDDKPAQAESLLHKMLLERGASLPKLYWKGPVIGTPYWAQVCEDIAQEYEIHDHQHWWSMDELLAVTEAIAEFHAAGLSLDLSDPECDWLVRRNHLRLIDGEWLRNACSRIAEHPSDPQNAAAQGILSELADRYDTWMTALASWQTVLHGDVFWANVGLRRLDADKRWTARLIDIDSALTGIPQYDVAYVMMRGWNADADWEALKRKHRDVLLSNTSLDIDERVWWWAYKLADLQLRLCWHYMAVQILDKGDAATEREIEWVTRGGVLWGEDFVRLCQEALQQAPEM